MGSKKNQKPEDLKYRLDVSVTKRYQPRSIVESFWEQLLFVRYVFDMYCQPLPLCTARCMAHVTDRSHYCQYCLRTEANGLVENQRQYILNTMLRQNLRLLLVLPLTIIVS